MQGLTVDRNAVERWLDQNDLERAAGAVREYFTGLGADSFDAASDPRAVIDRLAADERYEQALWQGLLADAVDAASTVRRLYMMEVDDSSPYRPMDRTTSDTRYYRSLDGSTWMLRPDDYDETGFDRQVRTAFTHLHNVHELKQTAMPVPDTSVLIVERDGQPEAYTVMERVGPLDAEPPDDAPIGRYNDLGYTLAVEQHRVSYFDAIGRDDFVPADGEAYLVNPGQYREGPSDAQLADSVVPDPGDWTDAEVAAARAPYHLTVTGQGTAGTVYKRGELSTGRAPVA
ncbi:MAG: hypothetical protein SVU88_04250 [Candidatus Nanohaloarchaea archaeon]|nr:hypothetical protein [Candidatus Nanohaloarchaea archaeon]